MTAFLKNGKGIWRGMRLNDGEFAVFAQPSTGKRRSENTYNFYTLFIDENPEWAEYPKRSNSFICSTSIDRAQAYGRLRGKRTCLILPKNGSKIGVVPANDIWNVEEVPFLHRELESIQDFAELAAYWTQTQYKANDIKNMQQLKKRISVKMLDDLVKEATMGDLKLQAQLKDVRGLDFDNPKDPLPRKAIYTARTKTDTGSRGENPKVLE